MIIPTWLSLPPNSVANVGMKRSDEDNAMLERKWMM
jgi:hypothetical protein